MSTRDKGTHPTTEPDMTRRSDPDPEQLARDVRPRVFLVPPAPPPAPPPPPPMSRRPPKEGDELQGKWRLLRSLGEGGSAVVWAAVNISSETFGGVRPGEQAAVKIAVNLDSTLERTLFYWEPRKVKRVEPPGVLHPIDVDTDPELGAYFAMALLEGRSVHELWRSEGPRLPVDAVVRIARQTLGVLGRAHAAGVVHRDIKPSNLFLPRDGELVVLDFGVAKMIDVSLTQQAVVLGTKGFYAPEQASGDNTLVDFRTDIWGVGATMFLLLTGRRVFEPTAGQPYMPLDWDAPKISTERHDLGKVAMVIDRALKRYPDDRWQTAEEMREQLRSAHPI